MHAIASAVMYSMILIAAISAGCASLHCAPSTAINGPLASVAFMQGHWIGESDGLTSEEFWTSGNGGMMVGMSRQVRNGRVVSFEFLRIVENDGVVTYLASPSGRQPPTPFVLGSVRTGEDGRSRTAQFENPQHDFPRLIRYTLSSVNGKQHLDAYIEGVENGVAKSETIPMQRAD